MPLVTQSVLGYEQVNEVESSGIKVSTTGYSAASEPPTQLEAVLQNITKTETLMKRTDGKF